VRRWEVRGGEGLGIEPVCYEGPGPTVRRMRGPPGPGEAVAWDVPALDDLDPEDPRLLPDGSRWVDAEALRRVVCHVAGVVS
jgi:hypothetical protein